MSKAAKVVAALKVDELTQRQAKAEHKRLAEEIAHHDKLYHEKDAPEISDADVRQAAPAAEGDRGAVPAAGRPDSPTQQVAPTPTTAFAKVRHLGRCCRSTTPSPTRSCRASSTGCAAASSARPTSSPRTRSPSACEAKIDGLSISLRYEDGAFVQRRDARRRHDRRGRHGQPAHHQGHPAQAEGPRRAQGVRRARRGLHGAQGVPGD